MKQLLVLACLLSWVVVPAFAQDAPKTEVILLVDRPLEKTCYMYRVLQLALEHQNVPCELKIEVVTTSELRRREIVRTSPKNYVLALGNQTDHERLLQPVCVPIQLGVGLGHRIMLTREDLQEKLSKVRTLEDLSEYVIGQGLGWSDVEILREAGLRVVTSPKATSIPPMMMQGRIDLYPRGLFEIDLEYERYKERNPDLVIEENLVLYYPLVSFFFTRKDNDALHSILKSGMEKAYQTGKLQDLIMTDPVFSNALQHLHLNKRVKIEIPVKDVSRSTLTALERFPFVPGKQLGEPVQ